MTAIRHAAARDRATRTGGVVRLACGLLALALLVPGCASWRGARLYSSGSEALERGDVARAIGDLERAADLVPARSDVYNHLGLAYLRAGREDEAATAFEQAVRLDCTNDAAQHNLDATRRRSASHALPPAGRPGS